MAHAQLVDTLPVHSLHSQTLLLEGQDYTPFLSTRLYLPSHDMNTPIILLTTAHCCLISQE